jgi:hypothetical protein
MFFVNAQVLLLKLFGRAQKYIFYPSLCGSQYRIVIECLRRCGVMICRLIHLAELIHDIMVYCIEWSPNTYYSATLEIPL